MLCLGGHSHNYWTDICDPIQQRGHLVDQVYSEIMDKIVCKILKKIQENTDLVNVVIPKVALQILRICYNWKAC